MSSFFSILYVVVFLPSVVILYNIFPKKYRPFVLLIGSYVFFFSISGKLLLYLLFSTLSVHHIGLWLTDLQAERNAKLKLVEKAEQKELKSLYQTKQRRVVLFGVLLHIGILLVVKYTPFFMENINSIFAAFDVPVTLNIPKILMPIGISFYTLQAVSYIFDVYREIISADRNMLRVALYMGFFPTIMEGPICRYGETAHALYAGERTNYNGLTMGIQRILYGMLKKIVVADRLNILIKNVFDSGNQYDGGIVAVAAICYTVQLYMEFSGTMDLVIGTAQIFNIRLPENFRQPFFSKSVSDFWARWHITLGTFFKDYIFYPLSMSKPLKKLTSKARKHIGNHLGPLVAGAVALFCVWLCNGLWHGAGWNYIFFGMYHFVLILSGNIVEPYAKKLLEKLHINREGIAYHTFSVVRTVILVVIGEMFFRANGLSAGLSMFKSLIANFSLASFKDETILKLGMDIEDFIIVGITLLIVLVISIFKEKDINVREGIAKRNVVLRWGIYYALIIFIIIFGAYGRGYVPVDPIYANF